MKVTVRRKWYCLNEGTLLNIILNSNPCPKLQKGFAGSLSRNHLNLITPEIWVKPGVEPGARVCLSKPWAGLSKDRSEIILVENQVYKSASLHSTIIFTHVSMKIERSQHF